MALQKENQRYVLDLKKKDAAYSVLMLEKEKKEEEFTEKIRSLSSELNAVKSELLDKKNEYSKQKKLFLT